MNAKPIAMSILQYMSYVDLRRLQRVCKGWRAAGIALERDSGKSEVEFALTCGSNDWMISRQHLEQLSNRNASIVYHFGRQHALAYLMAVRPEYYIYANLWDAIQTESTVLDMFNSICGSIGEWWQMAIIRDRSLLPVNWEHYSRYGQFFRQWFIHQLSRQHAYIGIGTMSRLADQVVTMCIAHLQGTLSKFEFSHRLNILLQATEAAMKAHDGLSCVRYEQYLAMFPMIPASMHNFLNKFIYCVPMNEQCKIRPRDRYTLLDEFKSESKYEDNYMRVANFIFAHSDVNNKTEFFFVFRAWIQSDRKTLADFCRRKYRILTQEQRLKVLQNIHSAEYLFHPQFRPGIFLQIDRLTFVEPPDHTVTTLEGYLDYYPNDDCIYVEYWWWLHQRHMYYGSDQQQRPHKRRRR